MRFVAATNFVTAEGGLFQAESAKALATISAFVTPLHEVAPLSEPLSDSTQSKRIRLGVRHL